MWPFLVRLHRGKEPPCCLRMTWSFCEHGRAEVELLLDRWRETFESHGLRVSRGKTEYENTKLSTFRKKVKTVTTFKYRGSLFDANGGAEKDVNNRVKIAWSKWRETTGVMCDRNIPTQLRDKSVQDGYTTGHGVWSRVLGS